MLFHPKPLASTDKVGSETEDVVDVMVSGGSSMVGIVLNIQSDESLRNSIKYSECPRRATSYPKVLQVEEKGDVECATKMPSKGSKFPTTAYNLENLALDLSLKLGIKLVPATKQRIG